jgi:site-specific DNA-methyltransferase (adenine-specific)
MSQKPRYRVAARLEAAPVYPITYAAQGVSVYQAESSALVKAMPAGAVDSIVTDPPYAFESIVKRFGKPDAAPNKAEKFARHSRGFMGHSWDTGEIAFSAEFWGECYRVLKPGGYALAFAASRNYHKLASALEAAGFEIRDSILWLYGTGFPKSHKQRGAFEGWGTALKPAHEPIVCARKPLSERTVAANLERHGVGALNIDGARIPAPDGVTRIEHNAESSARKGYGGGIKGGSRSAQKADSRFPSNLIHDGSPAAQDVLGDAARYFYSAKASKADRAGSDHPTVKPVDLMAYLCRLVTPPGGHVLDPFAGSGTTGAACIREGFKATLIEREASYVADIQKRLSQFKESA